MKRKKVFLITDYKGYFGSKYNSTPYRGGMDQKLLAGFLAEKGYDPSFVKPLREDLESHDLNSGIILFGSYQDPGLHYKRFMEDLAVALEASGHYVVPSSVLIRAHENKVFFEMLRYFDTRNPIKSLKSLWYGSFEEFVLSADHLSYPVLIKRSEGSMSRGVSLVRNKEEAIRVASRAMRTPDTWLRLKDTIRSMRHSHYSKESWSRRKIVVQEFVPGLGNDYKVLIFGKKYYVLFRKVRKGDYRASGQGLLEYQTDLPKGLLDFAERCFRAFRAPVASFDLGFDGKDFYLFEAQYVCFGTYTLENSPFYFIKEDGVWSCIHRESCLEEEFAESLAWYEGR